ncbi:MAG: dNTP triphosphohydrolase, partial [Planctomycetota bacterium]|nr:dNTP triphosphohydrolase [Planctomycetota bacterium]
MMDWNKLLTTKRWREIDLKTAPSTRFEGDLRSEFERDYGRAVFSAPFRRLQDKTQVFPMDPNDSVRTRLTHSIEVSSVARGIALGAGRGMEENGFVTREQASAIETIAATCGLVHDFGNPPFGHSGEKAIGEWFERQDGCFFADFSGRKGEDTIPGRKTRFASDFLRFEGNAQTIRLLARLQVLADFHGLNPTAATLSAACKYMAPSDMVAEEPH